MRPISRGKAPLPGVTPLTREQHRDAVAHLDVKWAEHAFQSLQRANEAIAEGRSHDARNYTWSAGVATDKVFAIREIPTQIVANLHEHRVALPDIMDKLAAASRVLAQHVSKGYLPVQQSAGVTRPQP